MYSLKFDLNIVWILYVQKSIQNWNILNKSEILPKYIFLRFWTFSIFLLVKKYFSCGIDPPPRLRFFICAFPNTKLKWNWNDNMLTYIQTNIHPCWLKEVTFPCWKYGLELLPRYCNTIKGFSRWYYVSHQKTYTGWGRDSSPLPL